MSGALSESTPNVELVGFLAHRDCQCPGCGYNLRGLQTPQCPECRQELELRVGLADGGTGRIVGALSGFLGGACCAVVCLILVAAVTIMMGAPNRREFFPIVVLPIIMLFVQGTVAAMLLSRGGRQWARRRGARAALGLGALGWGVNILFVVWFLLLVF